MIVETEQILHMNGGEGETSYARNSLLQRKVISEVKPILEESVTKLYNTLFPDCLKVGDLGCSSGPNALLVASEIIDTIDAKSRSLNRQPPTFQIFLNDLPGNDFNTIFKSLPNFYKALENEKGSQFGPCFIAGIPGSFHGRLFPANSMHFFHSSCSAHWLSQVPKGLTDGLAPVKNKGNIYVTHSSSPAVYRAFVEQFQQDFKLFLRSRSEELVPGGSMVVTIGGRTETEELVSPWGLLGMTLNDMVLENLIEEEKLENFDIPLYYPTAEEVRQVIDTESV
ncbi:Methyltransferase-like protein [Quillaja saponaria]|uniref:Methyltransferase-like protein n=1 Tax=Quillaja saponaria TaxID=32244 RepID=A0AAD7LZY2_QUISA|nr:Methyltransferase-like protein [Quillaja saponaria]